MAKKRASGNEEGRLDTSECSTSSGKRFVHYLSTYALIIAAYKVHRRRLAFPNWNLDSKQRLGMLEKPEKFIGLGVESQRPDNYDLLWSWNNLKQLFWAGLSMKYPLRFIDVNETECSIIICTISKMNTKEHSRSKCIDFSYILLRVGILKEETHSNWKSSANEI